MSAARIIGRALLALLLFCLTVEAAANALVLLRTGSVFYARPRPTPPVARAASDAPEPSDFMTKFSPYFGFTWRPGQSLHDVLDWNGRAHAIYRARTGTAARPPWASVTTNNFGFYAERDYPTPDDPDAYVVGVFGGSVTQWLWLQGRARLAEGLSTLPAAQGRPAVALNFAMSGYKQPAQQLLLGYFLGLGQGFDLVINLDGFNEAALGSLNATTGIDVSMPGSQFLKGLRERMGGAIDDPTLARLATMADQRRQLRQAKHERNRAHTATGFVLATFQSRRAEARLEALREDVPPVASNARGLLHLATVPDYGQSAGIRIAAQWRRGSEIMATLAKSTGAHYLHVLQPSQYATAHRLSAEERKVAFARRADNPYRVGAETVYPLLRQESHRLVDAGIQFLDGDGAFAEVDENVYADRCCHYTQRGNDALVDWIVGALEILGNGG